MKNKTIIYLSLILLSSCQTTSVVHKTYLDTENEIVDLIENPKKWNGKIFYLKIYPFNNGFSESYVVCFEKCDVLQAERSPFIIYTKRNRFIKYFGTKYVKVKVIYNSECFFGKSICPDMRFGLFSEL